MLYTLPMRVLVADDHRLFRQGLVGLMRTRPDLVQVVGEANTGPEALALAESLRPNLVLLDITMPGLDGLQAARLLRQAHPGIAVVMLTASEIESHLYEAVQLGAAGYLLKSLDAAELFELLEAVACGEAALTRAMAARLLKSVAWHSSGPGEIAQTLTERELDVLRLVAQGASNPEVASTLCITVNAINVQLRHILEKLQLANRTQAATFALQNGLVPNPAPEMTA